MTSNIYNAISSIKGLNYKDPIASMESGYALLLDNFFTEEDSLVTRKGYTEYSSGMTSHVETLAPYYSGNVSKLLAAANGNLWEAATPTAVSLASGFTNNRWQFANMDSRIAFVNGVDAPQVYNGTTMSDLVVSGPASVASLINILVFKGHSYFILENSQSVWYSALNALGGVLTEYNLSRVGNFGGKLMMMCSWSRDSGSGMNDLAVFVFSSGECVVYTGSSPVSADWTLVGTYRTGIPLSRRAYIKYSSDLVLITSDGFISMNAIIERGKDASNYSISSNIRPEILRDTIKYGSNFGWEAIHYPEGNKLLFNVPITTNTEVIQHVMNTTTKAWSRFKKIKANCWAVFNKKLYFGSSGGIVHNGDTGGNDNGTAIICECVPAFTYFGIPTSNKEVCAIRYFLSSENAIITDPVLMTDFYVKDISMPVSLIQSSEGSLWDDQNWDEPEWGGGEQVITPWTSLGGIGTSFSTKFSIIVKNQRLKLFAESYLYKMAGKI